jgi:hypothetical protein
MSMLRLSFSGLCTFVFDPPLSKTSGTLPKKATVLLQRLTRARALRNQSNLKPEVLDQHFPLLEFDLKDWSPESTRVADFHCLPDATGRLTKGVCVLNGEDLKISLDGRGMKPGALQLSTARPLDPTAPVLSPADQETLWWMATFGEAFPDRTLNPVLWNTAPGSNQPVLARIELTEGRLKTRELTDFTYTMVGSQTSGFSQRVAVSFELEADFGSKVIFEMTANRNGRTATSSLVLTPKDGAGLEIGISNMEIDRFIGLDPAAGPRVEADYEVYADLVTPPLRAGQPMPSLRQAGPGNASGMGVSSCAPWGW